jgi:hypothetical protein
VLPSRGKNPINLIKSHSIKIKEKEKEKRNAVSL